MLRGSDGWRERGRRGEGRGMRGSEIRKGNKIIESTAGKTRGRKREERGKKNDIKGDQWGERRVKRRKKRERRK